MVIDRDVEELPACAPASYAIIAQDALADVPKAVEPLAVDMYQLARAGALVANDRIALGARQPRETEPAQHLADRRRRPLEHRRQHQRACLAASTRRGDLCLNVRRQAARLTDRRRRPVSKRFPTALPIARPQPVAGRTTRSAGGRGRLRALTSKDQLHNPTARLERVTHP